MLWVFITVAVAAALWGCAGVLFYGDRPESGPREPESGQVLCTHAHVGVGG
jgi:hypothetical protein